MIQYSWLIPTLPALAYAVIILFTRRSKGISGGHIYSDHGIVFRLFAVGVLFELLKMDPAKPFSYFRNSWTWLQIDSALVRQCWCFD